MLERFGYKNLVAAVYIAALFMQIMDGTIINVALPTLAEEFDVDATAMDWTVLSFTIALAVMTASAGWFGQRLGLRRAFMVALGGFIVTSLLCGVAQSLNQLVAARALQGAAAGLITPIGSALLFNAFPIEERSIASRKVITVAVIAPALGPIVGGAILEFVSWRWIFFVNLPIGAVALLLAWMWIQDDE
ncbi:MAG: MFS family permease, partial [Acidimicrobiales bacterium]